MSPSGRLLCLPTLLLCLRPQNFPACLPTKSGPLTVYFYKALTATHATLNHHFMLIWLHLHPGSCHRLLPASNSKLQKVGGESGKHCRVSSRNTAAPSAPSSLSLAVWYLAPADSQLPSPQQLFQTFPSPRAPNCAVPSLTDDLTSYMTEKMEGSQLQLPPLPENTVATLPLLSGNARSGWHPMFPSRTPSQQPLLSGISNPSPISFCLLLLSHTHSLPTTGHQEATLQPSRTSE